MIDKALGMQPSVRRRRLDNTSQTSSNPGGNNLTGSSPLRSVKKLYQQESIEPTKSAVEEPEVINKTKPTPRKANPGKSQIKPTQSEQEIASPAVKNIRMAKVPLTIEDMKNSAKINLKQSAKRMEMRNSQLINGTTAGKQEADPMYKWKLLGFIIVSVIMVLYAMSPSRKAPARRN